jgi:hypothetical protein
MGTSRWDYEETRTAYAATKSLRATQSTQEIFTSRRLNEALDPSKVLLRESRDSEHNPNSVPIIIGLDVTGSMGIIAERLARGELGKLMEGIFSRKPVNDPHVMVMAIGDATCDEAPLQVSQFEADIRIDQSLQQLFLEGRGGGNSFESYDLPWYFAANRTVTDSFEKRNKKGYLFTIGDEPPPPSNPYTDYNMERVLGKTQGGYNYNSRQALKAAQERYEVFHVIIEQGNYCRGDRHSRDECVTGWTDILGRRALPCDNYEHLTEVILSAIEIAEGADPKTVIKTYQDERVRRTLHHALGV